MLSLQFCLVGLLYSGTQELLNISQTYSTSYSLICHDSMSFLMCFKITRPWIIQADVKFILLLVVVIRKSLLSIMIIMSCIMIIMYIKDLFIKASKKFHNNVNSPSKKLVFLIFSK